VRSAECGEPSAKCGVLSAAGTLGAHFPSSFALLAAQNRKCIVPQGLTHFRPVAKRPVSFRNFPKLSVSFRFVPEFSVSFRSVPSRSIGMPGARCLLSSLLPGAELGVLSAECENELSIVN